MIDKVECDKKNLLAGIGEACRMLRAEAGLSQLELACDADVSQNRVAWTELGNAGVSLSIIMDIFEALGYRMEVPITKEAENE